MLRVADIYRKTLFLTPVYIYYILECLLWKLLDERPLGLYLSYIYAIYHMFLGWQILVD